MFRKIRIRKIWIRKNRRILIQRRFTKTIFVKTYILILTDFLLQKIAYLTPYMTDTLDIMETGYGYCNDAVLGPTRRLYKIWLNIFNQRGS